jgi:hypothetical protein
MTGPSSPGALAATVVIEGAHVLTCDDAGSEYTTGHVVLTGNRVTAVGAGPAPEVEAGSRRVDG